MRGLQRREGGVMKARRDVLKCTPAALLATSPLVLAGELGIENPMRLVHHVQVWGEVEIVEPETND
jgi:hypothetical protein